MIWGVTGCVGAGKSTVCAILAGFGARVLDVDDVARRALSERSLGLTAAQALHAVVRGGPDRARIEAALVPMVQTRIAAWCADSTLPGILDAALLFEHGLGSFCDFTVCICCPVGERRRRVLLRSTASARLFDAIDASQWSQDAKAQRCNLSLSGNDEPLALTATLRRAWFSLTPRES